VINMQIKARFKGKHNSMGFRKGAFYTLFIYSKMVGFLTVKQYIYINKRFDPIDIPYETVEAFLSNWTDIKVLK